jgi:hypothetical protein
VLERVVESIHYLGIFQVKNHIVRAFQVQGDIQQRGSSVLLAGTDFGVECFCTPCRQPYKKSLTGVQLGREDRTGLTCRQPVFV